MNVHVIIIYYLLIINAVAFIVYGIDKLKARKGRWRISEATLLLLALVGGSIGSWLGMKVWHHKTCTLNSSTASPPFSSSNSPLPYISACACRPFSPSSSALSCRSEACDSSSASVVCYAKKLCALCVLCVKHIKPDNCFLFSRRILEA